MITRQGSASGAILQNQISARDGGELVGTFNQMKSLQLLDCQPDQIGVNGSVEFFRSERAASIAVVWPYAHCFANEGRRPVETMRFVPSRIVNQSFIAQFADDKIVRSGLGELASVFHFESPPWISI
jgi:hypothetical protein